MGTRADELEDAGPAPAAGWGDVAARLDAIERRLEAQGRAADGSAERVARALGRIERALMPGRDHLAPGWEEGPGDRAFSPGDIQWTQSQDPKAWNLSPGITQPDVASGGIDHDDAKALKRMADARKAFPPYADQSERVDAAAESTPTADKPWWLRPW